MSILLDLVTTLLAALARTEARGGVVVVPETGGPPW